MKPTEEEIQQAVDQMLEIFRKMDEFIFDSSYRIIHSLDWYIDDDNEDNSLLSDL